MKNAEVVGYIPKLLFKFYSYLKNRFDTHREISQEELYCYDICKLLINNSSSKLTIAPVSNKRYIKNDDFSIFVVIGGGTITLINHVYSYSVYCEYDKHYNELIQMIDEVVEKQRNELENEITSNIRNSLKKILENLS